MHGYDCLSVPPVELAWSSDGSFSIQHSIAKIPYLFINLARQVNTEARNMLDYEPEIIVSDTRLSSLLSARLLGIPSIVILNQIKLLLSPRLRELKIARTYEKLNGEFLGIMWSLADKILVPDLPPPYTLAEHNIWDTNTVAGKLEYVGLTTPKIHISEEQINKVAQFLGLQRNKPIIFVHVSGPSNTRMPLIRTAIDACKVLQSDIQYVISEGNPKGDANPKKLCGSGWYYEWCPVRDEIFAMSNALVLRGGHAALSQAIQFGKPILTIPIENHGEQLGNSQKIAKIGAGIMLNAKRLDASQIANAIYEVINDSQYQQKANLLMKLTEKLNGIENVVKIIWSYLK